MKSDEKPSTDITRREALKVVGKYGLYVPPTLAVLTAAPRAFAGSPGVVTISGTFSYGSHYGNLRLGTSAGEDSIWCGVTGSTFTLALTGLDPTQNWYILVGLSTTSDCAVVQWAFYLTLQVTGPDANRGTVSGRHWDVPGGAVTLGETLQVNFEVT